MAIKTASGTRIWIGTAVDPDTVTLTSLKAITTWTEIKKVESFGDYGDESAAVEFSEVGRGRKEKAKGVRDAGTLALAVGLVQGDPGQLAMILAEGSSSNYAFRIETPDGPTDDDDNTIEYFAGLVMSKKKNVGTSDNVLRRNFSIGINSEIFEELGHIV
ncbi:hypothetical protein ABID82_002284 [Methylobacterium sp. PvP062]|uniref:Phage tail protein n=1 Tax=Methylobacterium radiotolerans TaxID=31998 RepID=A0ABV2NMZ5_9HYPH|nr:MULTISPECIES: hypothetical protein [unclassified Methylobacterium]MBP2495383.1 hypothetical protein [Methylobacterium sp. PvP105]MBP2504746.1 hypothetical protein [Methylobacterium sp. PvP109]MCX7335756.1 hypothetical protein [Hyphomicrobiales bacterium]